MRSPKRGFTLIEMVVGMVLLSIALSGILSLLVALAPQAIDPVQQLRAAQLAQRILAEATQKSFDQNSDHNSARYRCGETVEGTTYAPCTLANEYGPDTDSGESAPYLYNDVDDFDTGGKWMPANELVQQSGSGAQEGDYRHFAVKIKVSGVDLSAGRLDQTCTDPCSIGKRVDLTVQLPSGEELAFTAFRGNY
ncbi:type IV pilus modification PilV family protein [Aeromonas simiae]|uniref:type IV pilus modification PilV family protein n=1 Tax=Aeromonas simiae TaxID=218936 RepID=UPI0005A82B10|nr:type II secretion system protein [Aeromonas simiae]MDO2949931.1 type II secretion system GspH family protein [Aeromonas simiae]MDO2957292.1 type II secretion system GspH family protein [Aeromonas simiae]